jgi:hypothetical protein
VVVTWFGSNRRNTGKSGRATAYPNRYNRVFDTAP